MTPDHTAHRRVPEDVLESSEDRRSIPMETLPVAAEANPVPSNVTVLTVSNPQAPNGAFRPHVETEEGAGPKRLPGNSVLSLFGMGILRTPLVTYANWRRERIARWLDRRGLYMAADAVRSTRTIRHGD